jgi:threonine dehydrogenase-like Zn-dependent dehydrogenase
MLGVNALKAPGPSPRTMRALVLDGVGFDHLQLRNMPVPSPGPQQMPARVDAAGICTSLIKLIEQGPNHRLMYGWDVSNHHIILGDEGSVTLVEIGEGLRGQYVPGERFVVQPAVDHVPINCCERYRGRLLGVGYTLGGHLAEYILITEEILAASCLLPIPDLNFPYAHAAMSEPFSCVVSAQDHHMHLAQENPRVARKALKGLKKGGVTVVIGAGAMGRMHVDLALSYLPRHLIVTDFLDTRLEIVRNLFGPHALQCGISLHTVNPGRQDTKKLIDELTGYAGADDIIVAVGSRQAIEKAQALAGRGAVLDLFGGLKSGEDTVHLDAGNIHYQEINVTGSSGGSPWDIERTLELMAHREIDAGSHITRIGDLEHSIEFLRIVKAQEIDGKAIVYPHQRTTEIRAVESWSAMDERTYLNHKAS